MKTNFFVKTAVVAMAAFGAFAFSAEKQADPVFSIQDGGLCTDIHAECSQKATGPICQIEMNNDQVDVYELNCTAPVHHDDSRPVNWSYVNP